MLRLGLLLTRDRSQGSDARYASTMWSGLLAGSLFTVVAIPASTMTGKNATATDSPHDDPAGV